MQIFISTSCLPVLQDYVLGLRLTIIFSSIRLVVWCLKCQKMVDIIPKLKTTPSNVHCDLDIRFGVKQRENPHSEGARIGVSWTILATPVIFSGLFCPPYPPTCPLSRIPGGAPGSTISVIKQL